MDNVLIAFEIFHHMKNKKNGLRRALKVKVGISKAYDRVDWNYLQGVLTHFGFVPRWIE